jgi:dolichol-phosphate mannosyltransferase
VRVLVVLPTYNELANIDPVCRAVLAAAPQVDILVVDDGSPDGTADAAQRLAGELGRIEVLRRDHKQGLGQAYLAGFAWGLERGYDALIEMDADLSHDPATLPVLIAALDRADLVIGSRYIPGGSIPQWSVHRRLLSRAGNRYSSLMLGVPLHDMTSGFRAFQADLLRRLPLDHTHANGYGFQIEMAYRAVLAGARIVEVPIRFVERQEGTSKMSLRITVEAIGLVTVMGLKRPGRILRSRRPGSAGTLARAHR